MAWNCYEVVERKRIQQLTVVDKTNHIPNTPSHSPREEMHDKIIYQGQTEIKLQTQKELKQVCLLECSPGY